MLDKLEPHKQMLSDLAETGCEIELIVAMYVESNTSEAFSPSLMQRLSEFGWRTFDADKHRKCPLA